MKKMVFLLAICLNIFIVNAQNLFMTNETEDSLDCSLTGYRGKEAIVLYKSRLLPETTVSIPDKGYVGIIRLIVNENTIFFFYDARSHHSKSFSFVNGGICMKEQIIPFGFLELQEKIDQIKNTRTPVELRQAKQYIDKALDFSFLYSSGMWKELIEYWTGIYVNTSKSSDEFEQAFTHSVYTVLDRVFFTDKRVAQALVKDLLEFSEQYSFKNIVRSITDYAINHLPVLDGELKRLLDTRLLVGKKAPELSFPVNFTGDKVLLFFYETGCNSCEQELRTLKQEYFSLQQRHIQVVTISADLDNDIFLHGSSDFKWEDVFCDYKGFDGINFLNYGVMATPTIFLLSRKGIVLGKYASLKEISSEIIN